MCHQCANAFRKHFPHLTSEQQINLLWCGTCYPAGDGDEIEKQVEELARKSGAEYEVAMEITHREFDEAWERDRPLRKQWEREDEQGPEGLLLGGSRSLPSDKNFAKGHKKDANNVH